MNLFSFTKKGGIEMPLSTNAGALSFKGMRRKSLKGQLSTGSITRAYFYRVLHVLDYMEMIHQPTTSVRAPFTFGVPIKDPVKREMIGCAISKMYAHLPGKEWPIKMCDIMGGESFCYDTTASIVGARHTLDEMTILLLDFKGSPRLDDFLRTFFGDRSDYHYEVFLYILPSMMTL